MPDKNLAADLKEIANDFYRKGKYSEAVVHYLKALEAPDLDTSIAVLVNSNAAQCYTKLKQYSNAVEHCTVALGIQPTHYKSLFRRAVAYHLMEKKESALQDYRALYAANVQLAFNDHCDKLIESMFPEHAALVEPARTLLSQCDETTVNRVRMLRQLEKLTPDYFGCHPVPPGTEPSNPEMSREGLSARALKNVLAGELALIDDLLRTVDEASDPPAHRLLLAQRCVVQSHAASDVERRALVVSAWALDPTNIEISSLTIPLFVKDADSEIDAMSRAFAAARPTVDSTLKYGRGSMWSFQDPFAHALMRAMFRFGRRLLLLGHIRKAIGTFTELLRLDPRDPYMVELQLLATQVMVDPAGVATREEYKTSSTLEPAKFTFARLLAFFTIKKDKQAQDLFVELTQQDPLIIEAVTLALRHEKMWCPFGRVAGNITDAMHTVWSLRPVIEGLAPDFRPFWIELTGGRTFIDG